MYAIFSGANIMVIKPFCLLTYHLRLIFGNVVMAALMTLLQAPAEDIVSRSVVQSHEFRVGLTFDLDFNKIKQHLSRGSVKTKLLLFQALRWVRFLHVGIIRAAGVTKSLSGRK